MDNYTAYLADALENAETEQERHELIVKILKHRPDIHRLMSELVQMEPQRQAKAINICNEILKPHTGKAS